MTAASAAQAAAWLGTQGVMVFGALALLLVAAVLLGWRLLKPRALTHAMRVATGTALAALSAAVFAGLAYAVREGSAVQVFDLSFADALARTLPRGVVHAAAGLTRLGDPSTLIVLGLAVGGALLVRRQVGLMLTWGLAMGGNGLLNPALKQLFARARPLHAAEGVSAAGFSFPSGHSSGTVVAVGMLAFLGLRLLPRPWHLPALLLAVLLAFFVGVSRIVLGVHYASDVAAGFASGTAWLALCVTGEACWRGWRHRASQSRRLLG